MLGNRVWPAQEWVFRRHGTDMPCDMNTDKFNSFTDLNTGDVIKEKFILVMFEFILMWGLYNKIQVT